VVLRRRGRSRSTDFLAFCRVGWRLLLDVAQVVRHVTPVGYCPRNEGEAAATVAFSSANSSQVRPTNPGK
jgi:hypothetical protein